MLPLAARNLTPQLLGDVGRRLDRRDALKKLLLTLGRAPLLQAACIRLGEYHPLEIRYVRGSLCQAFL